MTDEPEITDADTVEIEAIEAEVDAVDALPVLSAAEASSEVARAPRVPPPVQAAAVAATSFLAGAATLALLHRRDTRRMAQELAEIRHRSESARRPAQPFGLVPGRTYLLHIRVLGRPGE
jgi:hypothetical protein